MKRILVLLIIVFPTLLFSQNRVALDSLLIKLEYAQNDSLRVRALFDLSNYYRNSDFSKSIKYSTSALEIADKSQDHYLIAKSHLMLGDQFFSVGNYREAMKYCLSSLGMFESIHNKLGILSVNVGLGAVSDRIEQYDNALDYYFKALNIYNEGKAQNKFCEDSPCLDFELF